MRACIVAGRRAFRRIPPAIKELPGCDRRADKRRQHQKVARVEMQRRRDGFLSGEHPIRFGQNSGDDIGKIESAGHQKNLFHLPGASLDHEDPDGNRCERYRNVFADSKNFHGSCHTRKFRHGIAQIDRKGRQHHEEGRAKPEFLADKVGEPFARDNPHARAHFFADIQRNRHRNQRPQKRVTKLGAG